MREPWKPQYQWSRSVAGREQVALIDVHSDGTVHIAYELFAEMLTDLGFTEVTS